LKGITDVDGIYPVDCILVDFKMNGVFHPREGIQRGWGFDWKFRDLLYKIVSVSFSSLTFELLCGADHTHTNRCTYTVQRGDWSYIDGGGFEVMWVPYCGHVTVKPVLCELG
jgi:hypothetical protein